MATRTRKQCTGCKESKALTEFGKRKDTKDGLQWRCKPCRAEEKKAYKASNPEKVREQKKQERERNKEYYQEYLKEYYAGKTNEYKDRRLQNVYGISLEDFENMLKQQDNACLICTNEFTDSKSTHIDHCHKTGKVRGLLCHHCNTGIGHFKESIPNLEAAIAYLQEHA